MFVLFVVLLAAAANAKISDQQRIVGREVTIEDQFQYKAAVYYEDMFVCGGVILSPKHILAAAFCQKGEVPKHKVVLGSIDLDKNGDYQVAPVASFSTFDSSRDPNGDIAVITLTVIIRFRHATLPIPLGSAGQEPVHGEVLTALTLNLPGDGRTVDFARQRLHKVRLPVISHAMCNAVYNQTYWRTGYTRTHRVTIKNNFLCAGGGRNTFNFQKAYGEALVNDKQQLVGIISWGLNKPGFPVIFTSITKPEIYDFIRPYLESSNGDKRIAATAG